MWKLYYGLLQFLHFFTISNEYLQLWCLPKISSFQSSAITESILWCFDHPPWVVQHENPCGMHWGWAVQICFSSLHFPAAFWVPLHWVGNNWNSTAIATYLQTDLIFTSKQAPVGSREDFSNAVSACEVTGTLGSARWGCTWWQNFQHFLKRNPNLTF